MTDYKDTLNLPQTDFPMKANLPQREPEILKHWQEIDLYRQLREIGKSRPKYILHDGPPYANGRIHIGHALNKTLKDIIVKVKTLSNYDAPYVPGWDCHGLPIELNVEKKIGKAGIDVSVEEFLRACREYASTQIDLQREDFIRLGVIGDWQNPYLTMDFHYEANIIRALSAIIENGHLEHGRKPVHWCTECGSALAEAEVEYKDKESLAIDVMFRAVDAKDILQRFNTSLECDEIAVPIWTTTPWTLPANEAVALNPSHTYQLIFIGTAYPYLIVATSLVESVMQRYGKEFKIMSDVNGVLEIPGSALEGVSLRHPFLKREVPLVVGDHVTLDAGTGAVHTAPAHGQEDYLIGVNYKLPMDNPVDPKGIFVAGTPYFAGQHVFKANPQVVEVLNEQNNLLHEEKIQHSYAHCWRHKTPLIYRATPQWFISMEKNGLREQALTAINKVQWIPEWGKARISDMVQKRPDWCISRQRVWNTPIPLFIHNKTGDLHPDTIILMEEVAKLVEKGGIEKWFELDTRELLGDDANHYHKITDTLDVWFDSGVSHACVLAIRFELNFPADLYLEGSDQHRGWFQTSLLSSLAMCELAPFKTVLTHGYTVDANGRKMSKSLGNVIAPETIINQLGADILRLWVANTDYRNEVTVSKEIFDRSSEAYRRIRNTARFLLSNLHDFNREKNSIKPNEMLALDRWAVDSAFMLQKEILTAYDNFQFHLVAQKIHNFCTVEMGSFYLDIIKDRLYTTPANSAIRRSAQTAMFYILEALVRWIAPILSFTAEEIWQHMSSRSQPSVFMTSWYDQLFEIGIEQRKYWQRIMEIREAVNKELERCRNEGIIGSGLAAEVTLGCDDELFALLNPLGDELRFVFITSSATVLPEENYKQTYYKQQTEIVENNVVIEETQISTEQEEIDGLKIVVKASPYPKCQRCWHRREDIGRNTNHPDLCERCITNIDSEQGEQRLFA